MADTEQIELTTMTGAGEGETPAEQSPVQEPHFAHLHVHTEYSLLDGSNKISEYVNRIKELGMTSAAITDHGVMYGIIDFYKAARNAGIKPILGCEVYVAPGSRLDREIGKGAENDRYYHLVLLAENNKGYENLMKIVSIGFTEGYYYKPRVDKETLEKYSEGIIALSACLAGEVQRNLLRGFYEEGKEAALEYQRIFGEGNFFLELQDHGLEEQRRVIPDLLRMSRETGIGLVCTNDVHYTYAEDAEAHDILLCIQTGKKLSDEDRMRYVGGQYYVKSAEEMGKLFQYAQEALENTWKIAQRCNVEIEFGHYKIPQFECPDGLTPWEYLNKLCREGMERNYSEITPELEERLQYELDTIHKMGYVEYFLIVWDYIRYARDNGIMVGPGRGSAAGSLVSYSLGITQLDPIRYSLLFERFLNPERVSMPDIDVDFGYERRQEVIDYVGRKYGQDHVAQIVTFGTLAARGVLRDVGRVMDLPYALCDTVAKMVPMELNITLDKALSMNPEFKSLYESDLQIKKLVDMSRKLEGLPRHTSMHAAGVVICSQPVDDFVPLSRGSDGAATTQFTMTALEELGLLKMDFLGLRTLTVIQDAVRMAEQSSGKKIDMDTINYSDPKVYAALSTGKTDGVFQLESGGMQGFMKELKPRSLEDLIAGISLYRPGPMDFIPQYVRGKNHPELITYDCPQLKPILEPTYGCIVYQEQVMQIVRDLAGYTLGRSDLLRRAMSKKKASVMQTERQNFVYGNKEEGVPGCIANGIDEAVANKIYDEMIDFAKYAFNKSHAACYAVVSYQTAWLKYYYPKEYMAAIMTSFLDNSAKVAEYIVACRQMGIKILPPDINKGEGGFSVDRESDGIRYGLSAIKSVGRPVIEAIIRERELAGPFTDLRNFCERMTGREVNKRTVESFIKAGALDSFGATRRQLMMVYAQVMDSTAQEKKAAVSGQMSLFDMMGAEEKKEFAIRMPDCGEFRKEQLLMFEREVLGVYVSGHPLEEYTGLLTRNTTATTADFIPDEESGASKLEDGSFQVIGGMVASRNVKYTKKNQPMAFIQLEDLVGEVEVVVFPQSFERYSKIIDEDAKLLIRGRIQAEDEKPSKMICDRIRTFDEVPKDVWLQFGTMDAFTAAWPTITEMIRESDGKDQIAIYIRDTKQVRKLGAQYSIDLTTDLLEQMRQSFGADNVKVTYESVDMAPNRRYN